MPLLHNSGVISKQKVYGSIPACLFQMESLSVLHLGGNDITGQIPDVPLSSSMKELILASNELTGTIPSYIWHSNLTSLDLSLNRLQGTLPSDMLPDLQSNSAEFNEAVKLQVNQLAGTVPSSLLMLPNGQVNVLEGNLFSCNADRSNIPENDPKRDVYNCGSDSSNYGLIAFGCALIVVALLFSPFHRQLHMDASTDDDIGSCFQSLLQFTIVVVVVWTIGSVLFGTLSVFYSSYADTYVWVVSAIYKNGFLAALCMFIWLTVCLALLLWKATDLSLKNTHHKSSHVEVFTIFKGVQLISVCVLILVNIIIVTTVNGLYVSAVVNSRYNFAGLMIIAILLSMFKIAWNFVLLRSSQYVKEISDRIIMGLCLFNNILAPLLAEMFVSSDCFLYIISQAPSLTFDYTVYFCPIVLDQGHLNTCNFNAVVKLGGGTPIQLSVDPPFHYSYQCSFSLISSYAYVFIFRYIMSGLIEPMFLFGLRRILNSASLVSSTVAGRIFHGLKRPLFPLYRVVLDPYLHVKDIVKFRESVESLEHSLVSGMFRKRIATLILTDMSMLICFGALFPPLALVVALSVVKDVMGLRLSLKRYDVMANTVKNIDEGLSLHMMQIKDSMHEEILKAAEEIWHGVWYGVVMSSWIWAFVLFDTLSSTVGVMEGLWVLVVMAVSPFVINTLLLAQTKLQNRSTPVDNEIVRPSKVSTVVNPLVGDGCVEMRVSVIEKPVDP